MRLTLAAAMIVAAALPALADDPACGDATVLLDNVGDLLVAIEYFKAGVRDADHVAMNAESVADYGNDAIARTTDETWPADYLETLGKLVTLGNEIVARRGTLAEGDAGTIRSYGAGLKPATSDRCDADDIPVFIEPGGLACPSVLEYVEALGKHLPALRGDDKPMWVLQISVAARHAAQDTRAAGWSADTVAALETAWADSESIMKGDTPASAEAADGIVALAVPMIAEAHTICLTDDIPDLAAGT